MTEFIEKSIIKALHTVKDPEIDTVSIIDLGMLENIKIEGNQATIEILPTFLGCPALDIIEGNIRNAVNEVEGINETNVISLKTPPWTSDRVTEQGQAGLIEFGIAPPPSKREEDGTWAITCPYCGSVKTEMENLFGPTACRSLIYCSDCKNPFEAMKPVSI